MKIQNPLKNRRLHSALAAQLCFVAPFATAATSGVITGNASDAQVDSASGTLSVSRLTDTYDYIGGTSGTQNAVIYAFEIPTALLTDPNQQFTEATLKLRLGSYVGASMVANGDLYGIGYGPNPTVQASDFYAGPLDTANTLIQDNFLNTTIPAYASVTNNSASLVAYLNSALAAARSDGLTTAYVFFRISPDAYVWFQRYIVAMAESGASTAPSISYTADAVSGWHTVPLGGGGYVTGMVSDPTGNNVYIRTDVGGAFRWDETEEQWVSMTDKLVPLDTTGAAGLMGISALTVDPSQPNRLYLAAGLYSYSNPRGIYASEDGGNTWTNIHPTMIVEGNGTYRSAGDRLAVDPNDSNTLWFGSTQGGPYKGTKSGSSWSWLQVPATSVPLGQVASGGKAGVTFVVCDRNGGSTITYAGVFDSVGTTGGIYVSTDGTNWSKVGGTAFTRPTRARIAPNGTLYVTGGSAVGSIPRGGSLSLLPGLATDITYGALAVDETDASGNTLYVAQGGTGQYNKIFRTTNAGTNWSTQYQNFNNGVLSRKEPDGTPSVTGYWFGAVGAMLVNPTNSNELWAGDFFGGYRTLNANQLGTTNGAFWNTLQKGVEETVPHALKNAPTGARLISGLADVSGFRYIDTTKRPYSATGGNSLQNPGGGASTSLDFCESNPSVWARSWVDSGGFFGSGGVSTDGGVTWVKFGQLASKTVVAGSTSGLESWDVSAYLASEKAKGATEVTLVLCSGNSITPLYSNNSINFDSREATDPAVRPKLTINGSTVVESIADSYVANGATGTNYGTATSFGISYNYGNVPYSRWAYLKFDLSSISGPITTASLDLNRRVGSTLTASVGVYAASATAWTETGITWANKPLTRASDGDPVSTPKQSVMGGRIAVSSTDANRLVWLPEGTSNKSRYSTDRGVTWTVSTGGPNSQMQTQFSPGITMQQLTADRVNGKFYQARFSNTHTIYASTDGGATFASVGTVNGGAYNEYRAQLVAAPAADDLWLSDDGVDTTNGGGLWRSTDGGQNWTKLAGLTKVSQVTFGKAPSGSRYTVFINGKKDGVKKVHRSDDYGTTWVPLADSPSIAPIEVLSGDRQNYGKVFLGVHGRGVYQGQ